MTIAPTLDGRIQIDIQSPVDLIVLRSIVHDAISADTDLADRLTEEMGEDELIDDWAEFVIPDLCERFNSQVEFITGVIAGIDPEAPEPIFIDKENAETWYGGLNQARLSLEDRYQLAKIEEPEGQDPESQSAWFRDQLYSKLQWFIMDFILLH